MFHAPPLRFVLQLSTLHSQSDPPSFLVVHLFFPRMQCIVFETPFWFTAGSYHDARLIRYHKSSSMSLEFNFTHSPGPNRLHIQRECSSSWCDWWIVWSCCCLLWWNGWSGGWDRLNVQLISFDWTVRIVIWSSRFECWLSCNSLWFLNFGMH